MLWMEDFVGVEGKDKDLSMRSSHATCKICVDYCLRFFGLAQVA